MSKYRARPPLKTMNLAKSSWAAAIESFSRVNSRVPTLREDDLIGMFGDPADGSLIRERDLLSHLEGHGCRAENQIIGRLSSTILRDWADDIENILHKSHMILIHRWSTGSFPTWLVYGIDDFVIYMDAKTGTLEKFNWRSGLPSTNHTFIWHP